MDPNSGPPPVDAVQSPTPPTTSPNPVSVPTCFGPTAPRRSNASAPLIAFCPGAAACVHASAALVSPPSPPSKPAPSPPSPSPSPPPPSIFFFFFSFAESGVRSRTGGDAFIAFRRLPPGVLPCFPAIPPSGSKNSKDPPYLAAPGTSGAGDARPRALPPAPPLPVPPGDDGTDGGALGGFPPLGVAPPPPPLSGFRDFPRAGFTTRSCSCDASASMKSPSSAPSASSSPSRPTCWESFAAGDPGGNKTRPPGLDPGFFFVALAGDAEGDANAA